MFNRDAPKDPNTGEIVYDRPPYIRNQYGGTLGGPVIKDKTFFFFSFQGGTRREGGNSFLSHVASPLARNGDFSQEQGSVRRSPNIYAPLTLVGTGAEAERQPFPNNVIPPARMDPAAAQVLQLYPLPNVTGAEFGQFNYFRVVKLERDNQVFDTRIDHNFNDRHRIFGRYSFRNEDVLSQGRLPFPGNASQLVHYRGHQFSLNYNATLGATSHNEFRFGYTHFPTFRRDDRDENLNQTFGIPNSAAEQFADLVGPEFENGLTQFNNATYHPLGGGSGGGASDSILDNLYVADNFLIDRGNHSIKFGAEFRRWTSDHFQCGEGCQLFGRFNFDGRYTAQFPNVGASRGATGHTLADMLLGMSWNEGTGLPGQVEFSAPYWGFYIQDDWRATPRLTVSLGLRWEFFNGPQAQDIISEGGTNFVATPIVTGNIRDETSAVLPIRFDHWQFPEKNGDCGCKNDMKNWAPRIGIAYRVGDNTVIRAGAGLYYSENGWPQGETNRFGGSGPQIRSYANAGSFETTDNIVSEGFQDLDLGVGPLDSYRGAAIGVSPEFISTINNGQWFLDVQHQLPWDVLATIGYNGLSAHHLPWWIRNVATPLEAGTTNWRAVGTNRGPSAADFNGNQRPQWVSQTDNLLNANYNAFTAKVEKRWSDGFSYLGSFTWSKAIDYGIASIGERGEGIGTWNAGSPPSAFLKDINLNRGRSGLSRSYTYSMSILYELPAGPGKGHFESGPASWVLGGWQFGGILQLQSGPFGSHRYLPQTQNTNGPYRADLVGEINYPESQRDASDWFNQDAIQAGPPGQFGNAGRGLIELAGWKSFDLLLSKNFSLPWEGHRVQFRFEAFNLTNTPHFGPPGTIGGGNVHRTDIGPGRDASRIINADEPRIIQFALKYVF